MDLQDEPVVEAHLGHLGQHLGAEQPPLALVRRAAPDAVEQLLGRRVGKVGGLGGRMAVVARGRAELLEIGAALAMRVEIARPGAGVAAGDLAKLVEIGGKALEIRIDDRVGPIGGDDAAVPAAVADHPVPVQIVERAFGGGDRLDVEALEQRARPVGVASASSSAMRVVMRVGGRWPSAARRCRTGRTAHNRTRAASACRERDDSSRRSAARSFGRPSRPASRRASARRDPPAGRPG